MYRFPTGVRTLNRIDPDTPAPVYRKIKVEARGVTVGAEIKGVDLALPLTDDIFTEIDTALREWKVITFRGQSLSQEKLLKLAQRWGTVYEDSLPSQVAGGGEVIPKDNALDNIPVMRRDKNTKGLENIWHTDAAYRKRPVLGTFLVGADVPAVGGDTMFADMAAAYDNLDEDIVRAIEDKDAWHDWTLGGYAKKYESVFDEYRTVVPPVRHPVVIRHPRTGRKTLFVNRGFTREIIGMDADTSDRVLDILTRQADVPEYQFRVHWEPGLVAFWDNYAVQHYAVNDYWPQTRVLLRATIAGPWTPSRTFSS